MNLFQQFFMTLQYESRILQPYIRKSFQNDVKNVGIKVFLIQEARQSPVQFLFQIEVKSALYFIQEVTRADDVAAD